MTSLSRLLPPQKRSVMEQQLARTPFFTGDAASLADVALYAYTHVAHEGGLDLSRFPAVQTWLARFAALPGFVAMPHHGLA